MAHYISVKIKNVDLTTLSRKKKYIVITKRTKRVVERRGAVIRLMPGYFSDVFIPCSLEQKWTKLPVQRVPADNKLYIIVNFDEHQRIVSTKTGTGKYLNRFLKTYDFTHWTELPEPKNN